MANINGPFLRGKDVQFKMYQNGNPILINAKNWSVEQNATEVADGVCGENRDRLDLVTNYFSATVDIYYADEAVMQMVIDSQTNRDGTGLPLAQSVSIRNAQPGLPRAAYRLKNCVFGPWSTKVSSRTESNMTTIKVRFTNFDRVT